MAEQSVIYQHKVNTNLGEYYRDLSANYNQYYNNELPWPERPEGWFDPTQGRSLDDYPGI